MRLTLNHLFLAFTTIVLALMPLAVIGAEKITDFHAEITVEENGDLLVTEKITVISEGDQIKRGIYRDFPLLVEDGNGRRKQVGFEVLKITRDGNSDDWHRESAGNFARIYIGNADVFIENGTHIYEITYRTDRQLRFFDDHDELFWNVTGTEWRFAIDKASARVQLPPNVEIQSTNFFTGAFGSKAKNAQSSIDRSNNSVSFSTTRPLGHRAGLTIGIKMKKGSFAAIPEGKSLAWFLRDYIGEVTGVLALLFVAGYYFIRWWQIGRDPPSGVIVPNWDTSSLVSPALVNYIEEKGFGSRAWKAMSAAILNLAVKGYVVIEQLNDKPTITRTDKVIDGTLPIGEAKLIDYLDKRESKSIRAIKSQGVSVNTMHSRFKESITTEHRDSFYSHNWGTIALGIFLSVVCIILIFVSGGVNDDLIAIILPVTFGTVVFSVLAFKLATIFRENSSLTEKIFAVVFIGFSLVGIIAFVIFSTAFIFNGISQPLVLSCFAGVLVLNIMFFFLLGAPTRLGRDKMDAIEGLKTYLVLAEKDRMNLAGAPTMSPKHYETLLPYAVALGVEKPWSNTFKGWLATASAAAAGYAAGHYGPDWYRGDIGSESITDSMAGMADNMASSFTASLPAPKSSSSGFSSSGGFSGGGGGGGGGGGW